MRVTAETKLATDRTIRAAARRLFNQKGVAATSTREIAIAAGIATGTMFNYFESKEALAVALAWEALEAARGVPATARPARTLDEDLFALIARDLRALQPLRAFVGEVIDAGLSPLSSRPISAEAGLIRTGMLEAASEALARHGAGDSATPGSMHLFWSLYLGLVSFWSTDNSPAQEDTWALLDQSARMFAGSVGRPGTVSPSAPPPQTTPPGTASLTPPRAGGEA